jgi:hypothetical protein
MLDLTNFLQLFASGTAQGCLVKRQTTYWDIQVSIGPTITLWRVTFPMGAERRVPKGCFSSALLYDQHPLLHNYQEPWGQVYTSGSHPKPDELIDQIAQLIDRETLGYRSASLYLNSVARAVLADGHGLLLNAPISLVSLIIPFLQSEGLNPYLLPPALTPKREVTVQNTIQATIQALLLGNGYIIASSLVATQLNT